VDQGVELTPASVAEMVNEFIGLLDLHDVTLVGNDTGGGLCQLLVDAHPDSVGPAGADQLRRLRQVPAVPVQRRLRDDAGTQVDPLAVQADEGDRAAAFAPSATGCCYGRRTVR